MFSIIVIIMLVLIYLQYRCGFVWVHISGPGVSV